MTHISHPRYRFVPGQPVLITEVDERDHSETKRVYLVQERIGEHVHFRGREQPSLFLRLTDTEIAPMLSESRLKVLPMADRNAAEAAIIRFQQLHPSTLTEEAKAELARKKAYIDALNDRSRSSHKGRTGWDRVLEVKERLKDENAPTCLRTVQAWRRAFELRDGTIGGLIRKRDINGQRPSRLHPIVQEVFDEAISRYYMNKDAPTLMDAYGSACTMLEEKKKAHPAIADQLDAHYTTFTRWLRKKFDQHLVNLRRHDRNTANRRSGMVGPGPTYDRPLQVVFIDSTPIDLIHVDALGNPRERLTLTVAIDAFSRMVVGFYLGPDKPSWITVSEAIRCGMAPKGWVQVLYKDKTVTPWPCCGQFEVIVVDWGPENRIKELPMVLGTFGIDADFNAAEHPDWKGVVERFFREANRAFHTLPGTTKSNPKQLGKLDPIERAREEGLTFDQIFEFFTIWLVDIYHNHLHRELGMSPLQKWEEGCKTADILPQPSDEQLAVLLGRIGRAQIQKYGINFLWMRYSAPELRDLRPGDGTSRRVKFYYDPGNLGCIWVEDQKNNRVIQAFSNKYSYASQVTEAFHRRIWNELCKENGGKRPTRKQLAARFARLRAEFVQTKPPRHRIKRGKEPGPARRLPRDAHFRGLPGAVPLAPAGGDLFGDATKLQPSAATGAEVEDRAHLVDDEDRSPFPEIVLGTPPDETAPDPDEDDDELEDDVADEIQTDADVSLKESETSGSQAQPVGPEATGPEVPDSDIEAVCQKWLSFDRKKNRAP